MKNSLSLWQDNDQGMDLNDFMNQFLGRPRLSTGQTQSNFFPLRVDVQEKEDSFLVSADIPGVKEDDINIDVHENRLTISGERSLKREAGVHEGGSYRYERSYGKFSRSFLLPSLIDEGRIEAHYANGVLEILIPKQEKEQPKKIKVGTKPGGVLSKFFHHDEKKTKDSH